MASRIAGITIEIAGDATPLQRALKDIDGSLKTTQSNLKDIDRLLKFNPGNTELLTQKQKALKDAIEDTKRRLQELKDAQNGVAKGTDDWDALQREIIETESKLKNLKKQYSDFGSVSAQKIKAVGEEIEKHGKKIADFGDQLTRYVSLPIFAAMASGVKNFAEVDKTMQLTNKTMQNTEEEAARLNTAMEQAAANSTYGMSDAATATLNFARAGLDAEQAASALAPAMNLAAGEGGNLDTVSAGLVATINGFQDGFEQSAYYADIFAAACNNSALDVDSLSESMSIAAPVFSAAGYSVQDAALYMGIMANNGIDANTAATALKTGMARLAKPAKEGAEALERLGIEVFNADGSMKDSVEVQKLLHDSFANLSEQEQIAAASAIFGKNQMSNWLALINAAPEDVNKLNKSLSDSAGTTNEMAEAMMGGFGGSIEKLKSSLDVLMTSLGRLAAEYLQPVIDKVQGWIDKFNGLDDAQKKTIVKIAGLVMAIGPLLSIGGRLAMGIGAIMKLAPLLANPWVLAIAGIIAVSVVLIRHWDEVKAAAQNLVTSVTEKWASLKENVSMTIENLKNDATEKWNNLKLGVETTVENLKSSVTTKWENMKSTVSQKMDALKQGITSKWDSIKQNTTNKLEQMFSAVKNKFEQIKNAVSNAVSRLKSIMDFHWELPHLKMPHISISGHFSINPPSVPHFSIDWYKKAYDNPMMFTSPTVLGTPNGLKGFGDGHGAEIVIGLNKLRELVSTGVGGPVINVYAAPGQSEKELAFEIENVLVRYRNQRLTAYA